MTHIYHLMVKTHLKTKLKYLCYTRRKDPIKYLGSGVYWKKHLNKHGKEIHTTIILSTSDYDEIKSKGQFMSRFWNIMHAVDENGKKIWANLKEEKGDGGFEHIQANMDYYVQLAKDKWNSLSDDEKAVINAKKSRPGKLNGRYGKEVTEETKSKMSKSQRIHYDSLTKEDKEERYAHKKGKMIVKNLITGETIGLVETNHPKVLSGEWVHNSFGTTASEETKKKQSIIHRELGTKPPSSKGKKAYNNGIKTTICFPGEQPEGWVEGHLTKTKLRAFTDGSNTKMFVPGKEPEGWV
jgi:hypothetical protein